MIKPGTRLEQSFLRSFGAGAGKTMLMDLFYKATRVECKQRVHFNSFMLDVHNSESKALP